MAVCLEVCANSTESAESDRPKSRGARVDCIITITQAHKC